MTDKLNNLVEDNNIKSWQENNVKARVAEMLQDWRLTKAERAEITAVLDVMKNSKDATIQQTITNLKTFATEHGYTWFKATLEKASSTKSTQEASPTTSPETQATTLEKSKTEVLSMLKWIWIDVKTELAKNWKTYTENFKIWDKELYIWVLGVIWIGWKTYCREVWNNNVMNDKWEFVKDSTSVTSIEINTIKKWLEKLQAEAKVITDKVAAEKAAQTKVAAEKAAAEKAEANKLSKDKLEKLNAWEEVVVADYTVIRPWEEDYKNNFELYKKNNVYILEFNWSKTWSNKFQDIKYSFWNTIPGKTELENKMDEMFKVYKGNDKRVHDINYDKLKNDTLDKKIK